MHTAIFSPLQVCLMSESIISPEDLIIFIINLFTNLSLHQNLKKINRGRGDGWLTFKT